MEFLLGIKAKKNDWTKTKSVLKFDLNGKLLNRYKSIKEASMKNNIGSSDICDTCKKNKLYASNFIWFYEDEFSKIMLKERLKQIRNRNLWGNLKKRILQINIKTNKIIKEWESVMEAYRKTGINNIYAASNKKQYTDGGYI